MNGPDIKLINIMFHFSADRLFICDDFMAGGMQ